MELCHCNLCRRKLQEPFLPVPIGNVYNSAIRSWNLCSNLPGLKREIPEGMTSKTNFCLNYIVFQCPDKVEEWQQVAIGFQAQWYFPNCLGALNGQHINIHPPPGTGSIFFNCKHTFSIVLMALWQQLQISICWCGLQWAYFRSWSVWEMLIAGCLG